jgi:glycosyltransferase involved in cell wall biosynthesis
LVQELQKQNKFIIMMAISHNRDYYLECRERFISLYLGDTLKEASVILSRLLKGTKTIVVSNGYHSSYLVFLSRLLNLFQDKECKFVDIKHGWITINFKERFKTFLDKLIAIFYDCIILVNPFMKRDLWFVNKKKLVFIASGIPVRNELAYKEQRRNPFKILLVGRLAQEKRFKLAIESLSYTPKNLWQLTIVGDGPELEALRMIAIKNNIYDRVNFVGYQKNIAPFYKNSDLIIISSVIEGCPLVALEAMSFGVLVLSTNVGYMSDLLDQNRGILVDVNITTYDLSKVIMNIISLDRKDKDQIINNAWNFVYKNHNISRSAKIFKNITYY